MEENYPDDDSADLDKAVEIFEHLEEVLERLRDFAEQFRPLGYNIGIVLHTYDPLLKDSFYTGEFIGDRYAVLGCLRELLNDS